MALGDLDGDGDLDAVVAYFGGDYNFRIWLNEDGRFVPGQSVAGQVSNPEGIALADLNGDGNLDIVIASAFGSRIWFNGLGNDPPGTFSPSPQNLPGATRVAVGDLNGNQLPDIVLSGWVSITIWLNAQHGDPPGTFREHQTISRDSWDLALGDLDGDGDLDAFVVVGRGEPAEIWWNGEDGDPPGTFRDSGQRIDNANGVAVALGDLNGNGYLDAVIGIGSPAVRSRSDLIWINDGTGHGRLTGQCLGSAPTLAVALADLDGDKDLDLFAGHFFGGAVWLNNEGEVCFCIVDWLQNLAASEGVALLELEPREGVADVYRALRDRIFIQSEGGRRLARLYDRHNAEIFTLILANGALRERGWSTLKAWAPHVQALLEGEGGEITISESQADAVAEFLDALSALASPTLAEVIQAEREALEVAALSGQTLNAVLERVESRSSPRPEIRIEYEELSDGTGIELRWMTDADRSYRVVRSVGGLDDFSPIGLPMIGDGQVLRYPVPFSAGEQAEFFQIQSRPLKF